MEELSPQPTDIEKQLRRDGEAEEPALREIGETHLEILISQVEGLLEVNWGLLDAIGDLRKDIRKLTGALAESKAASAVEQPDSAKPREQDGRLDFGEL